MKLWPARTNKKSDDVVADLDAMLSEPVHFRYNKKVHTLKPMGLDEFLKFTNAQNKLLAGMGTDEKLDGLELAKRYHAVIESVCDTMKLEDIKAMSQAQVAALYQLVIDLTTGQVDVDGKKKD